ncbi:MAG: pyridoxamine 5'-phosphate oxidase family protein [Alphaproteobacteria bacterium]|nr:pyridoxamine 5'-phosphate oxidase family protein [Alphaproteobacteria bacterium]
MNQAPSARTRIKRLNKRAKYDAETVHAILDAMPICSVGYVFDGSPYVTPTLQWREGDHIYWHGSSASRMLEACEDAEVCVTVSIIDGFVMARSAFNHSCNYRSVMVFGRARKVSDPAEKEQRLRHFTNRLWPGRWDTLRPATPQELKATSVLSLQLNETSAKVRTGPPGDDEEDYALPLWAGVIPVSMQVHPPVDDPRLIAGLAAPGHVRNFKIGE